MADIKNDIHIFETDTALFHQAADDFAHLAIKCVKEKGVFNVVLLGGNTAKYFFDALVKYSDKLIPWEHIQFFFGDERYVPHTDDQSNYHTAYEHLFSKKPILSKNIYAMPTDYKNPKEAAQEYEKTIKTVSTQFDIIYLGLGDNAHTASLMPYSDVLNLPPEKLVASLYVPDLKMYRLTLTPQAINNSHRIVFLVTGANKAAAVKNVLEGPYLPEKYPAQLIHCQHGETVWFLAISANMANK